MKLFIAGLLAGSALMTSASALALATKVVVLRKGDNAILSDGQIACAVEGTPLTVVCGKISRPSGYTVGINRSVVSVSKGNRFVFSRRCC